MRATSACPMPPGGLPQRVVEAVDLESCSSLASELLVAGDFSEESCLRLLRLHFSRPQTNRRKSVLGGDDRAPFHILGFFSSSTGQDLTNCWCVNMWLQQFFSDDVWCSIASPDNAFVILVHRHRPSFVILFVLCGLIPSLRRLRSSFSWRMSLLWTPRLVTNFLRGPVRLPSLAADCVGLSVIACTGLWGAQRRCHPQPARPLWIGSGACMTMRPSLGYTMLGQSPSHLGCTSRMAFGCSKTRHWS